MEPILLYGFPAGSSMGLVAALEWLGKPYKLSRVDMLGEIREPTYKRINPRGETPLLITDKGETLTETMAIAAWLEARDTEQRISFDPLSREADRMHQLMAFINTGFTGAFVPLWAAMEMETPDPALLSAFKHLGSQSVIERHDRLEEMVGDTGFLIANRPTLADGLLVGVARWLDYHQVADKMRWPKLAALRERIEAKEHTLSHVYDYRKNEFKPEGGVQLPFHPDTHVPLILVPKRWLRFGPWISYDDYFQGHCPQDDISHEADKLERVDVLNFNRANYNVVDAYIREKERTFEDCKNDPLFAQIPVVSARRKLAAISKLPTGKNDNADREYEKMIGELFPSLLYPQLDFAAVQSRTDSGSLVRDLIFYNSQSDPFLKGLFDDYASRQLVFELKNVREVSRDHVNQLNGYMTDDVAPIFYPA